MSRIFPALLCLCLFFAGCGGDPADGGSSYDPSIHKLSKIELNGAETLALSPTEVAESPGFQLSSPPSCDDLGELKGAIYERLGFIPGNDTFKPCFKNVGFWKDGAIFGQYRPADSSDDVWFVTDEEGNVHHLPGTPRRDYGFKNEKRVRLYKGKPVYLNNENKLTSFDMSMDEEAELTSGAVRRYVVLNRQDGEHLVYQDADGAGKRIKPAGLTEVLGAINDAPIFYANESEDLEYNKGVYLKRVIFDASGAVMDDSSTVVPQAYAEWLGSVGEPMPTGPIFSSSVGDCEKLENVMICGSKGYVIADSSVDIQEVDWNQFEIYGENHIVILCDQGIYFAAGDKITEVQSTIDAHLHIIENISTTDLACSNDGGILVKGYNADFGNEEEFHYKDAVKTFLTAPISEFIR